LIFNLYCCFTHFNSINGRKILKGTERESKYFVSEGEREVLSIIRTWKKILLSSLFSQSHSTTNEEQFFFELKDELYSPFFKYCLLWMTFLQRPIKEVKVGKLALPLAIGEFARLGSTVVDSMFLVCMQNNIR
jgi:hypothetical protein